jgi:hypothetical protein
MTAKKAKEAQPNPKASNGTLGVSQERTVASIFCLPYQETVASPVITFSWSL